MACLRYTRVALLACLSAVLAAAPASAEVITYNIHWEGYGTVAPYADGVLTLDTSVVSPFGVNLPSSLVKSFSLAIHNTAEADGNYTLSDFSSLMFDVPVTLNFHQQLCGQAVTSDRKMCDSRGPGSFYMTTGNTLPFSGNGTISLVFANSADEMYITSFAPVPEPGEAAMLLAGLGVLGWMRKRRRS